MYQLHLRFYVVSKKTINSILITDYCSSEAHSKHSFTTYLTNLSYPGYLDTSQLLLLWDRVIGYNTLEILPVVAVAIFAFRRNNLMEVIRAGGGGAGEGGFNYGK